MGAETARGSTPLFFVKFDAETLQKRILTFWDQKVILDVDLARIYGVATKKRWGSYLDNRHDPENQNLVVVFRQ